MTARIIYHDFHQKAKETPKEPRLVKITARINKVLGDACLFLCGACTAFGVLAIIVAVMGF